MIKEKIKKIKEEMFGFPMYEYDESINDLRPISKWYRLKLELTGRYWEGQIRPIPWHFGFSYRNFDTDTEVYYPIPINIIVAFFRWLKLELKWQIALRLRIRIHKLNEQIRASKKV